MKRTIIIAVLAACCAGAMADLSALIPYTVPVETSKPLNLSVMSGEAVTWQITFEEGGAAKDLTGATDVDLNYTRTGVTYQVAGEVYNATSGIVRVPWWTTNATPRGKYDYVIAVTTGSVSMCRARGSLSVADGVSTDGGSAPIWLESAALGASGTVWRAEWEAADAAYSNHVRQVYLRGVDLGGGEYGIYLGD